METYPQRSAGYEEQPKAVYWFKVYTGFLTGLYVLCLLGGVIMLVMGSSMSGEDRVALMLNGTIFLAFGLPFSVACALPFFLPRKPWVWIYDLVVICIGLTSCCTLPAAIPLLIYWLKPDAKAWFGRT